MRKPHTLSLVYQNKAQEYANMCENDVLCLRQFKDIN